MGKTLIYTIAVITALVFIIAGGYYFYDEQNSPSVPDEENISAEYLYGDMQDGIIAQDIRQEGQILIIPSAMNREGGYVVAHTVEQPPEDIPLETSIDVLDLLGDVVGASAYIPAGRTNNVRVDLDSLATTTQSILLTLYADDDRNRLFNSSQDSLVQTADGSPVIVPFTFATTTPNEGNNQ